MEEIVIRKLDTIETTSASATTSACTPTSACANGA
jgi:hypothetical protein